MSKIFFWLTLFFIYISLPQSLLMAQEDKIENRYYVIPRSDSLTFEMDEVVVTGTRTSKRIIDIPYSVSRLSNVNYKYDKKISISDVLGSVPGLFMQSRYGNHDVRISIRGFGSRSNSGIRGVRILLDDIPESEPDGQTRIEAIDFNSIGHIEIVKGNSSSLYTNAPGGVVNFINDVNFTRSFVTSFNEFGSFGLKRNGLKLGIRTPEYGYLLTYSYHNYQGYRSHSSDYWNILNTVLETYPNDLSRLQILGYFVSGLIRLPGSLTLHEFKFNPMMADSIEIARDTRRISKKGRVGIRFSSFFDESRNDQIELTAYGTIKYFERTAKDYRIINRYGIGSSFKFMNKSKFFEHSNEFSIGGDLLYQAGPIESFKNIFGQRGDGVDKLTDEVIGNAGFFISNSFDVIEKKLSLLLTGRYDNVVFEAVDKALNSRSSKRSFNAFTPKLALNYKLHPTVALYSSYGLSFDSPAGNELDNYPFSSQPAILINPDLRPQKSKNFEIGVKGNLIDHKKSFLRNVLFEATFFSSSINDEIVPFEVNKVVYYRNSAKTSRNGFEFGLTTEILSRLNLKCAYAFSNFKYKEYLAKSTNITGDVIKLEDFSNNTVPSVPKHNVNLSLSYEYKILQILTLFLKENLIYVSGMQVDDRNSESTDSYSVWNTLFGSDLTLGRFNILVSMGVNNMFNKTYVGFVNINSTSGRYYEAGEPRSYFGAINLGYTF